MGRALASGGVAQASCRAVSRLLGGALGMLRIAELRVAVRLVLGVHRAFARGWVCGQEGGEHGEELVGFDLHGLRCQRCVEVPRRRAAARSDRSAFILSTATLV